MLETSPDPHAAHKWITVGEAAIRVHRKPATVRRWCRDGILPAEIVHKPTGWQGQYLIDREALDDWVRNGCFTTSPCDGDAA
jgi:excisionase family DNA binding protein